MEKFRLGSHPHTTSLIPCSLVLAVLYGDLTPGYFNPSSLELFRLLGISWHTEDGAWSPGAEFTGRFGCVAVALIWRLHVRVRLMEELKAARSLNCGRSFPDGGQSYC